MSSKVMRNKFDIGVNYIIFNIVNIVVYGRANTEKAIFDPKRPI